MVHPGTAASATRAASFLADAGLAGWGHLDGRRPAGVRPNRTHRPTARAGCGRECPAASSSSPVSCTESRDRPAVPAVRWAGGWLEVLWLLRDSDLTASDYLNAPLRQCRRLATIRRRLDL